MTAVELHQHESRLNVHSTPTPRWGALLLALVGSLVLNGIVLWLAVRMATDEREIIESHSIEMTFAVAPRQPVAEAKPLPPVPPPLQPAPPQPPKPKSVQPPKQPPKAAAAAPAPSTTPTDVVPKPEPIPVEQQIAPNVESSPQDFPQVFDVADPMTDSAPLYNAPFLKNKLRPPYPPAARQAGVQGAVVLKVVVNPQGKVESIEVTTSSGSAILDNAAVEAASNWKYWPAYRGGQRVTEAIPVPIRFSLEGG